MRVFSAVGRSIALGALLLGAVPLAANASVITFGAANVDRLDLNGPFVEGLFTYAATGDGWEIQDFYANPGVALATFFNNQPATVGGTVDFTLSGGGQFSFNSLDWRTVEVLTNSDDVVVEGFLGGGLVDSITLDGSSTTFANAAGFAGAIDLLRIRVTADGSNALIIDNINLTPAGVPEPGTLALGLLGALVLARRRKA